MTAPERLGGVKGALIGGCVATVGVTAAGAYYWLGEPSASEDVGFYRMLFASMVGIVRDDEPIAGAAALVLTMLICAIIAGALVGRRAARLAGAPSDRAAKVAKWLILGYLICAVVVGLSLATVRSLLDHRLECVPCIVPYALFGGVALLPLAIIPLGFAAYLVERATRLGSGVLLGATLATTAAVAFAFSGYALKGFRHSTWSLPATGGASCTIQRGMTRRDVRQRCGRPTDLGRDNNRMVWTLDGVHKCDVAEDAYGDWLVLYDCRAEVADVALFAARGIHRVFTDDFETRVGDR